MTHHTHVPPALGMELGSYDAGFKLMVVNYINKTNNCKRCRSKHTKVEATKAEVDQMYTELRNLSLAPSMAVSKI